MDVEGNIDMEFENQHLGIDLILDDQGELVVSPSGDLALTQDGRKSLMQDVKNLLQTLPGDLFSHPEYGCGLSRLLGDDYDCDQKLIERTIGDALLYNQAVASRIEDGRVLCKAQRIDGDNGEVGTGVEVEVEIEVDDLSEVVTYHS